MRTTPLRALTGLAVAAALVLAPATAATATTPTRTLSTIVTHEVAYAPNLYQIDATISAVTGGTVRAYVTDAAAVRLKDIGVVGSTAIAGTVTFAVQKADFVGAGHENQLYVEIFNAKGVRIDGQGILISKFLAAPVTLTTAPGLAVPTLVKTTSKTLTSTLTVTKGQFGTSVKVTMWSPTRGQIAEYLNLKAFAPQKVSFVIPTADFGGSNGNFLKVHVYNSAGTLIDSFAYTAALLAPALKL
ncbi:hypothetical protein KNO15_16510 [Leifsonia shinshuensis]|uniref:hypothetical protein n=1 Tax=Leifsonia shinshuensis TaxID=150026 RepID=UPI001F507906|nr:hypothetical protein [Leifsonia shinshuensis]MCI0158306.1 hypothetical protein [Leifsonia shinshuensis]